MLKLVTKSLRLAVSVFTWAPSIQEQIDFLSWMASGRWRFIDSDVWSKTSTQISLIMTNQSLQEYHVAGLRRVLSSRRFLPTNHPDSYSRTIQIRHYARRCETEKASAAAAAAKWTTAREAEREGSDKARGEAPLAGRLLLAGRVWRRADLPGINTSRLLFIPPALP